MSRYKMVDRSPRFLPIVLEAQLIPGSFEHALDVLVDTEIDFSGLAKRFRNDDGGAPAYDPAVMLKIVLLAYSRVRFAWNSTLNRGKSEVRAFVQATLAAILDSGARLGNSKYCERRA